MPPKPPTRANWHPPLEPEDAALWEAVKKTVKRLSKAKPEKPLAIKAARQKPEILPPKPAKSIALKATAPSAPTPSFDRTSLRKIKSGKIRIDERLDLHGLRQDAAQRVLESFIASAQLRGCKLLLVITGKGDRFAKTEGVLRKQVPRWLKETNLSGKVLSFSKAAAAHGGEGAFYVRLRKQPS
jgi:DNA-nicking Smr family endonuclease